MPKLSPSARAFLALVERSPDIGGGWRVVSTPIWPLVEAFEAPELIQLQRNISGKGGKVRLTDEATIVLKYL